MIQRRKHDPTCICNHILSGEMMDDCPFCRDAQKVRDDCYLRVRNFMYEHKHPFMTPTLIDGCAKSVYPMGVDRW